MNKIIVNSSVTSVYERNIKAKSQILVNRGGTRSSKSFSICQILIEKFLTESNKKILILRKTLPSLKISTLPMFKTILGLYQAEDYVKEEKQSLNYYFGNNLLHFDSMDDPRKKKSTEWNYIWFEEVDEFTYDDFQTMKLYLSAPTRREINQIFISFNPVDEYSWIKEKLIDSVDYDFTEIVSNYKDNIKNLNSSTVKDIEGLINQDENFYRIYALGQWGRLEDLVFTNWGLIREELKNYDDVIYGIDFGFNNPSAITRIGIKDQNLFIDEVLYEIGLTNIALISKMNELIAKEDKENCSFYCDSAEPDRIKEIEEAGFIVVPAAKGKNSVMDGINTVKSAGRLNITGNSINLKKELSSYSWKKDRNGRVLDEPVKFKDHLIDSFRMAYFTYKKELGEDFGFGGWV